MGSSHVPPVRICLLADLSSFKSAKEMTVRMKGMHVTNLSITGEDSKGISFEWNILASLYVWDL